MHRDDDAAAVATAVERVVAFSELPWRAVAWFLVALSVVVVVVSLAVPPLTGSPYSDYDGWVRQYLDVGREGNFPTWWSSSLLLLAAAAFAAVALIYGRTRRRAGLAWLFFALVLLAFSADEATLIHDRARHLTYLITPATGLDSGYAWLGVGIPVGIIVLTASYLAARNLPALPRRLVLLGLGLFMLGAVAFEILHAAVDPHLEVGFLWVAIYHVEELLEMCGVSVVLAAALAGVRYRLDGSCVALTPSAPG